MITSMILLSQGMILASGNNFPAEYSLSNLGFDVAIKTGTPQNWRNGEELTDTASLDLHRQIILKSHLQE